MSRQIGQWWYTASGQRGRDAASLVRPGVVIGRRGRRGYAVLEGAGHVCVEGPCRSGKGVGILIPTLLAWRDPAFVVTVNDELIGTTAGWRAMCSDVWIVDPYESDGHTHRYNPLDDVQAGFEIRDTELIAKALVGTTITEPFWQDLVKRLFTGLALYLRAARDREGARVPVTIGETRRLLLRESALAAIVDRAPDDQPEEWTRMLLGVIAVGKGFESVRRLLLTILEPWGDPQIDAATSACDFSLLDSTALQTVYLNRRGYALARTAPLVRLMMSRLAARECKAGSLPCLAVLDDAALLHDSNYASYLNVWTACGVRAITVMQADAQFDHAFGEAAAAVRAVHRTTVLCGWNDHENGAPFPAGKVLVQRDGSPDRSEWFESIRYFSEPVLRERAARVAPKPPVLDIQGYRQQVEHFNVPAVEA